MTPRFQGGLDRVAGVFEVLFQVPDMFLHFAFCLVFQSLCLLLRAAYQFTDLFLNFATQVFCCALDLIFVLRELLTYGLRL